MDNNEEESLKNDIKDNFYTGLKNSKKIFPYVIILIIVFAVLIYLFNMRLTHTPRSMTLTPPKISAPAGGENNNERIESIDDENAKKESTIALKKGESYTASLINKKMNEATPSSLGTPPSNIETNNNSKEENNNGNIIGNPFVVDPNDAKKSTESPQNNSTISYEAENELFNSWSGKPLVLTISESEKSITHNISNSNGNNSPQYAVDPDIPNKANTRKTFNYTGASLTSQRGIKPIIPAGHGVYGHSVLNVNSDLGGTVIAEVDTGPLAGARVIGSFQRKDIRLVIQFSKLVINENDPMAISAFAIAPDSMETGVASEVNEHYLTRILLPAAAAFVEGLGNAFENTNTRSVDNGLGGVSSFTKLTLPQQMGMAAGRVGEKVGQIIEHQTPQQPTVILHQGDAIGIVFTSPVYSHGK